MEQSLGGFGRCEFAEKYVEVQPEDEQSKKEKTTKEYLKLLDDGLEELCANKAEVEYNLNQAKRLYPEDSNFIDWEVSYKKLFTLNKQAIVEEEENEEVPASAEKAEKEVVDAGEGTSKGAHEEVYKPVWQVDSPYWNATQINVAR